MKNRLMFPLVCVALVGVACGGDDDRRAVQQSNYETVQEGSAAGVTSTISGPGEVLPPVTGTNADTTTAFTIDPSAVASAAPPAMSQPVFPPPQTSAAPSPEPLRPAPVTRAPEPAPQTEPAPPTETVSPTESAPPTQTDTVAPPELEHAEPAEEEPPPTTTDTRGP